MDRETLDWISLHGISFLEQHEEVEDVRVGFGSNNALRSSKSLSRSTGSGASGTGTADGIGGAAFSSGTGMEAAGSAGGSRNRVRDDEFAIPGLRATESELTQWEETNFPYKLPVDLSAFFQEVSKDGFSVQWTVRIHGSSAAPTHPRPEPDDVDDVDRDTGGASDSNRAGSTGTGMGAGAAAARASLSATRDDCVVVGSMHLNGMYETARISFDRQETGGAVTATTPGSTTSARGVSMQNACAGFVLEETPVGRVVLVYHKARDGDPSEPPTTAVWLQDLSATFHFICDTFTAYVRLGIVHLWISGWQAAFIPDCGMPPATRKWAHMFCPERLVIGDCG